jgi:hypothetical protein
MKVIKYSQFSMNESKLDSEYFLIVEKIDHKITDMKRMGASNTEISESIMDVLGSLGGGFTDRLKNYAAGWLLDKLGLPSDNAFLSEWVKNIVEQIQFTKIGMYFGKGSCKYWIDAVVKGLLETLEEKALNFIFGKMGYEVNFSGGIGGTILGSVREALTNALNDTKFVSNLAAKLDGTICGEGTSFSSVFSGGSVSDKDLKKALTSKDGEKAPGSFFSDLGIGGSQNKPQGEGPEFTAKSFWNLLGI